MQWVSVLWSNEPKLGLTDASGTQPMKTHSAYYAVWGRRNNGLALFRLGPLVPVKVSNWALPQNVATKLEGPLLFSGRCT